jgi:hypothetical protein
MQAERQSRQGVVVHRPRQIKDGTMAGDRLAS